MRDPRDSNRTGHTLVVHLLLVAIIFMCLLLVGCEIRTSEQVAKEDEIKQQIANISADIFEAAQAISDGAPAAGPLMAIKVSAGSIITSQNRQYPPAEAFLRQATQKMQPGTGPLPAGLSGRGSP